jgi:hypothetical protein
MPNYSEEPERPRAEPEIIPPGRSTDPGRGAGRRPPPFGFTQNYGAQRVYIGRIGPLGFALLLAMVGLFGAVLLLVLIGAALIWIPVVAVLVVIAAVSGLLRRL